MKKLFEGKNKDLQWKYFSIAVNDGLSCVNQSTKICPSHLGDIAVLKSHPNVTHTDGILTKDKDILLYLKTADCIPVILYWPDNEWFGLMHIGYKELLLGMPNRIIKKVKALGLSVEKAHLVFGPHICSNCYNHKTFKRKLKWRLLKTLYPNFTQANHGNFLFDLAGACAKEFVKRGVKKNQIDQTFKICTNCDLKTSRHHKIFNRSLITFLGNSKDIHNL